MRLGDSPEEQPADRMAATVRSPTAHAETIARTTGLRGEQAMTNREHPFPLGGGSAQVRSCWMCGIRLHAGQMVADGGGACLDVRWYCRDIWGCTRRWTSRPARLIGIRPDVTEVLETPGEQVAGLIAAEPVAV